ncbi:MAG: LamG-like jellyroll fold domain-containing protein [Bacteroidia bacterium]|nr:LamG-like jellyroll fold domain-containing protein [Bacteroidia bacterium]
MNKRMLRMIALLVLTGTSMTGWTQALPEILYYNFNGTGTAIPNLASNPPAGTDTAFIVGNPTQGNTGQCGGALVGSGLTSGTDYVNTGWATSLTGTSWTISFWASNIQPSSTLYYIFGDNTAGSLRCFTNGVAGPNNWILRGPVADVSVPGGAVAGPTMTTFVYDTATSDIKAYLNGVLVNTVAQNPLTINGTGPFKVGGYATSTGLSAGGLMDEFRIYNRALSEAEILDLVDLTRYDTLSVVTCDEYLSPDGTQLWTTSGTYTDTVASLSGCDSVVTVNLTILNSSANALTVSVCDSYTSPGGTILTTSGTFTDTLVNSLGCDSLVAVNLTINVSTTSTLDVEACDSYTAPDGAVYTASGAYTAMITNVAGCDSTISLNLSVSNSSADTVDITACDAYVTPLGDVLTTSGVYTEILVNTSGCDSVLTIFLTIPEIITTVTQNGSSVTADQADATYQWFNCATGAAAPDGSGRTFTASASGSYAAAITLNGCQDTTDCVALIGTGLGTPVLEGVRLYPNPGQDLITLSSEAPFRAADFRLMSLTGQVLYAETAVAGTEFTFDISSLPAGIYLVELRQAAGTFRTQLIKR